MIQSALQGKKVIVIGASTGIGFAVAKCAALSGAVVTIASSSKDKIEAAALQLPKGVMSVQLDAGNEGAIADFFKTAGNFDHLIYTAGENLTLSFLAETEIARAKQFFNTRYWGALAVAKYAAPYIKGSITFTGGIAGSRPGAGWAVPASICSAMEGLTRALSVELAPVRVNLVAPGIVKTPLWDAFTTAEREGMYENYAEKLPVKFVAEADDIAKAYMYLMEQNYATGTVIVADGGGVLV